MSDIKGKYMKILDELQSNIKNKEDLAIAKEKFMELTVVFMDIIDRLTFLTDERVKNIEEKQAEINNRLSNVQSIVDGIEEDIYADEDEEDGYEFEIVCPYCNYEFTTDIADEERNEIKCPKCNNIIELDWNTEEEYACSGDCSHCHEQVAEDNIEYNKNSKNKKKKDDSSEANNEDDM